MEVVDDNLPKELNEKLAKFHKSLGSVRDVLEPLCEKSLDETQVKPIDRAKFYLVAAYALNSLFWVYLTTKGEIPQDHSIKHELERIRSQMTKVKEIIDKEKAPHLDVPAAKRFVKSALWTPKEKEGNDQKEKDEGRRPKKRRRR